MAGLPDELIIDEILVRLPVKSLLRFRCVSKQWCAFINSNNFAKQHLSLLTKTKTLVVLCNYDDLYSIGLYSPYEALPLLRPMNPYKKSAAIMVIGSCNGLLCLLYRSAILCIIIWNPTTHKHIKLRLNTNGSSLSDNKSPLIYGFGYDRVSDDYKVVVVYQSFTSENYCSSETCIYSVRSDSWRLIEDNRERNSYIIEKHLPGALICGVIHWIASTNYSSELFEYCRPDHVVAIDLTTEKYSIVTLPDNLLPNDQGECLSVSELGGCLSIVCNNNFDVADVWVMKNYGMRDSWTKFFTLSCSEFDSPIQHVTLLAYSENGDEVLLMLNFEDFFWYNIENRTLKFVDLWGYITPNMSCGHLICLESLVSLGEKSEND